jgi:hypothetical protein
MADSKNPTMNTVKASTARAPLLAPSADAGRQQLID